MSEFEEHHLRISQRARDQLITLKRKTGISHWNELCRWAFCRSLAEPSPPPDLRLSSAGGVEMTWRVFAGAEARIYEALLKQRCRNDGVGLDPNSLVVQLRLHLHRGIGYLCSDPSISSISTLLQMLPKNPRVTGQRPTHG